MDDDRSGGGGRHGDHLGLPSTAGLPAMRACPRLPLARSRARRRRPNVYAPPPPGPVCAADQGSPGRGKRSARQSGRLVRCARVRARTGWEPDGWSGGSPKTEASEVCERYQRRGAKGVALAAEGRECQRIDGGGRDTTARWRRSAAAGRRAMWRPRWPPLSPARAQPARAQRRSLSQDVSSGLLAMAMAGQGSPGADEPALWPAVMHDPVDRGLRRDDACSGGLVQGGRAAGAGARPQPISPHLHRQRRPPTRQPSLTQPRRPDLVPLIKQARPRQLSPAMAHQALLGAHAAILPSGALSLLASLWPSTFAPPPPTTAIPLAPAVFQPTALEGIAGLPNVSYNGLGLVPQMGWVRPCESSLLRPLELAGCHLGWLAASSSPSRMASD